ncbi:hypothetical protein NEOC84_000697|nr:hypothetical protein [Neochlamydia sp. AcF84]
MVFNYSLEELKHCDKKSRFSQIRQRINPILLTKSKLPRHLIAKTCGVLDTLEGLHPFAGSIRIRLTCFFNFFYSVLKK